MAAQGRLRRQRAGFKVLYAIPASTFGFYAPKVPGIARRHMAAKAMYSQFLYFDTMLQATANFKFSYCEFRRGFDV